MKSILSRNNIKLVRFPFSLFLLPISLFSVYLARTVLDPALPGYKLVLIFFTWHVLVYPSSNGYNSYHDRDSGPIGGLRSPPPSDHSLLRLCTLMDLMALILGALVNWAFFAGVFVYITLSRLYSSRQVRLKKYPVTGFVVVFICQGLLVLLSNLAGLEAIRLIPVAILVPAALSASFFVGTMYPLTQIYQHRADFNDGVRTLSMLLGVKGTFVFSGLMFAMANLSLWLVFRNSAPANFTLFPLVMAPAAAWFLYWALLSFKDPEKADFRNTMVMLVVSSLLNNLYFLIILLK